MEFVRRITDGVNHPRALAIGPSGDLFVANEDGKNASVTVCRPGNSAPVRRITNGIKSPWTLAVDSKGRLYVAHTSEHPPGGRSWISVYQRRYATGAKNRRRNKFAQIACNRSFG